LGYLAGQSPSEEIYRIQLVKPLPIKSESTIVDAVSAFQHYDLRGRTWERQAFVQAQPIAGDLSLGEEFLQQLQPWVYRRYLSDADIAGLGALQRKLQRKLSSEFSHRNAGIDDRRASEDIEQMVLFLQLLHGHEYPDVRLGNTFDAIDRLAAKQLLRDSVRVLLQANYRGFRQAEAYRCLQGNLSTLHATSEQRRQIAEDFEATQRAINARLEESFPESQPISVETDLILDPKPEFEWIERVLKPLGFVKSAQAYQNLVQLSEENVSVLSTRRCRYYFSKIAPKLLRAIQVTTDPDQTLANLTRIAESIGGKGVLWELFSSNQATMELMVRLGAYSSYLVSLLTQSPGMIDELMDSLLVDRLPRRDELELTLAELCRGTDDIDRVLHEFKNSMHLRVGVRDILGKESIVDTHRSLSDIAEVCIARIIEDEYRSLTAQFGVPYSSTSNQIQACYSFLALGKLGGQEPNYHSDLSCVLLFDKDGVTQHKSGSRANGTTVRHFFEQLAQRVMRRTNRISNYPRLYELDVRFGPLGKSGVLAMQLDQFVKYFKEGYGSVIERQSLCKARPICGPLAFSKQAMNAIAELIREIPFTEEDRVSVLAYRADLQSSASIQNLKRGEGGTFDIECLVQLLQLKHAREYPEILVPGTLDAIGMLGRYKIIEPEETQQLFQGYHILREIEAGIRLMNMTARHDLPEAIGELNRLAVLLGWPSGQALKEKTDEVRSSHRAIVDRYTGP
jgi:glutamate-ammonia-ligase adenylyltransferase